MFLLNDTIANNTDDDTPYPTCNSIHNVINDLWQALIHLSRINENYLKVTLVIYVTSENASILKNNCNKLLGMKIDHKYFLE